MDVFFSNDDFDSRSLSDSDRESDNDSVPPSLRERDYDDDSSLSSEDSDINSVPPILRERDDYDDESSSSSEDDSSMSDREGSSLSSDGEDNVGDESEHDGEGSGSLLETKEDLQKLTVEQLKQRLRESKMPVNGNKDDLIDRLLANQAQNVQQRVILTHHDILLFGLVYAGFEKGRQNVREKLNVGRFKSFFGPDPRAIKDLFIDLEEDFPDIVYKEVMMALNWLKLCK